MKAIADRKKTQNIGEYLIYMYQMEDLIRSYQGNLEEIYTYVISHYPVAEEEKQEIKAWFGELAAQMQIEGLLEKGIKDCSIAPCDIRMTGNSIMGSINWIPKWFHGDEDFAARVLAEFPEILCRGLRPGA